MKRINNKYNKQNNFLKKITLISFLIIILCTKILSCQTPSNDPHWQLLWEDEFNFFDNNKWVKANYGTHGNEPQLYLESNVYTSNGQLIIKANNNSVTCPPNPSQTTYICGICNQGQTYSYNAGWVETTQLFNVQYGYIEAKIKLPYFDGLWPAFWTWTGNPSYQEIDIFEMVPGNEEGCNRNENEKFIHTNNHLTSNIHYTGNDPACDPKGIVSKIDDYTQWHTYGIEWSPTRIIWYVDNSPVRYYHNNGINAPTSLILNLAINPKVNVNGIFPTDMIIDWVKVYQLNEDCNDYINESNYDFTTYNNLEKNFILIGQDGGNNSLSVGQDIKLRASQFIEIKGDFYVPLGASMYVDANGSCLNNLSLNCTQTFNPCAFDFSNYDNSVKKNIELGGNNCALTITPSVKNIQLRATETIILKPGVSIFSISGKSVELKHESCQ